MSNASTIVEHVQNLHGNIADDVWPSGAILKCKVCGFEKLITTGDCAYYLAHGWPEHCGQSMLLEMNE